MCTRAIISFSSGRYYSMKSFILNKKLLIVSLLLIIPVLILKLVYSLYLGRAVIGEVSIAGGDYPKSIITSFYYKNGFCPSQKLTTTIKFAEIVYLEQGKETDTCNIRINISNKAPVVGGKVLIMSTKFINGSTKQKWVCSTDTFETYLPPSCK